MHIRKISNYTDFISLKKDWNNLLKESGNDSIFLRHEWFDCWWRSHAETYEDAQNLSILLIEDKGKCIGIIPLKTSRVKYRGLKVKKLGFLESGLSPCADVILTSEKEGSIREALHFLKKQKEWDILILNKLSIKSENYKLLEKILKEENFMFGIKSSLKNPIIPTVEHWPDFLSKRSAKFRKSLRYKLNKAKKLSSFQIERISEPNDIKNILPLIFKISKKSWKAKSKQSIADRTAYRDFFEYFTDEAGKMGWINVWLLKNSEDYIAYEYHLMYDGIAYPIGADFDESSSQLSPGSILEYHIIKGLFEDPEVKEYNTCAHSYKYLRNWTDIIETHADIEIFNSMALPLFLYSLEYKLLPSLRRVPLFQQAKNYLKK
jgi:hypothetical protein